MNQNTVSAMLDAKIILDRTPKIRVEHDLANEGSEEVGVFDRFFRTTRSGQRVLDQTLSYVIFESGNTIHITRSVIPIPMGLKVEVPEVPYLSILPPGQRLQKIVEVPVPVKEYKPYEDIETRVGGRKVTFTHVYFSIGVLPNPRSPEARLKELTHVGQGIYSVCYEYAVSRQRLVKTDLVRLTVEGLVY